MNESTKTKKPLRGSLFALFLCIVLLIGTTFAWFTDTASTGVNKIQAGNLDVELFGRGFAWLDTGTMDSLVDAADFVRMVEKRQGVKISAPEEIAYRFGWIDKEELLRSAEKYGKSPYGTHLKIVAEGTIRSSVRSTKTQE